MQSNCTQCGGALELCKPACPYCGTLVQAPAQQIAVGTRAKCLACDAGLEYDGAQWQTFGFVRAVICAHSKIKIISTPAPKTILA